MGHGMVDSFKHRQQKSGKWEMWDSPCKVSKEQCGRCSLSSVLINLNNFTIGSALGTHGIIFNDVTWINYQGISRKNMEV